MEIIQTFLTPEITNQVIGYGATFLIGLFLKSPFAPKVLKVGDEIIKSIADGKITAEEVEKIGSVLRGIK